MLDYGAIILSVLMEDKNGKKEVEIHRLSEMYRKLHWISISWRIILLTMVIIMVRPLEGKS